MFNSCGDGRKNSASTVKAWRIATTKRPDGSEWVWWQGKAGGLRAAVLVDGELPVIVDKTMPAPRKPREPKVPRCRHCDRVLYRPTPDKKYCCRECCVAAGNARRAKRKAAWRTKARPCPVEGCRRKGCKKHYPSSSRSRAEYWGVKYEPIINAQVYERDGWICGLCGGPVDKQLKKPDVMRVSLDHVMPISRGGDHLWDNVQCAHLLCNMRKHNKIEALTTSAEPESADAQAA